MNTILVFTPTWIDPATGEDAILPECAAAIKAQTLDDNGVGDFDWHVTADNPFSVGDHRNVLHQYQQARDFFLQSKRYAALLTVEHDNVLIDSLTIQKMWSTPGDVIYAPYLFRGGALLNICRFVGSSQMGDSLSLHPGELDRAIKAGTRRVSGVGFGCTLFHRRVVEALEFRASSPVNPCPDYAFAIDALRAGLQSFARMDAPVEHINGRRRLHPFHPEPRAAYMARRSKTVLAAGRVVTLRQDQSVELTEHEAEILMRAGYMDE
jgi:hypothetical protein